MPDDSHLDPAVTRRLLAQDQDFDPIDPEQQQFDFDDPLRGQDHAAAKGGTASLSSGFLAWSRRTAPRQLHPYLPDRIPLAAVIITAIALLLLLSGLVLRVLPSRRTHDDILQYIDPLIGTGLGGHVFAGPSLPFGMSKPVTDVAGENMGGFASDDTRITGFSHLHDSGTGGSPSMGNFPIFIHPDCPNLGDAHDETCPMIKGARDVAYRPDSVKARAGYFSIDLESNVRAEMTTSHRAALYRFSFRNSTTRSLAPLVLADGTDLKDTYGEREINVDPGTGRFTASGRFGPSFGTGSYHAYMCADFRGAAVGDIGSFDNQKILPNYTTPSMDSRAKTTSPNEGVYVRFANVKSEDVILARVGTSWLSTDRACENAEREIEHWDLERLVAEAEDAWRAKLSPIKIDSSGVDVAHLRNFWSGLYRAFLSPQDYTGENQLWNSSEPYYDSWYCIWDTFRGVHPLYMLIDTVSQSRMVRSLVDVYRNLGWLPDCRMSFCKGFTQGGSNADVVIVDSYIKHLDDRSDAHGIDWAKAYAAIVKDAEEQPPNWQFEGRGGLESWKSLGYIPYHDNDSGGLTTRSISRTYEYAYNDFCIAQMANSTGRHDDYVTYSHRANNWQNLVNPNLESMGFKGFPQPRLANGTFAFQNATLCSPINSPNACFLDHSGHETYEGSPWLYSFYVPHDMAALVESVGGRDAYLSRLDKLHNSGVLYMGDVQAFLTAFLYHYAGRPGLSVDQTHRYIPSMFNDSINGIPGNDDSGSMGTFVLFSMLGVFPNAGQDVYLIIPPYFPSVSITSPVTGKTATIKVVNFDPTYEMRYVQWARLDGKMYTKNWIGHDFFLDGGVLELVVGAKESDWGTRVEDLPPSLSTTNR